MMFIKILHGIPMGLKVLLISCMFFFPLIIQAQTHGFKIENVKELQELFTYSKDTRIPLICAKRGGKTPYPSNSIQAFEYVLEQAPAMFECDVRVTRDNQFVLFHDSSLETGSNGKGLVENLTLAQAKQLFLKDTAGNLTDIHIPELKEVLAWAKGRTVLFLDVRSKIPVFQLVEYLEENDAISFVVIITYEKLTTKKVSVLNPEIMRMKIVRNKVEWEEATEEGIMAGTWIGFVGKEEPKRSFYRHMHKNGICTILNITGELDESGARKGKFFRRYYEKGADILYTDYPIEAHKGLLKEYNWEENPKKRFFKITY